ncbi:MAG TPA: tRNA pseudouridine(55) synthase TruB [Kofleriaceae bacterium]|nr:tRNA pseudouridine(55) synthase TruB [Kofleriaceae bacterium]
MDHQPLSLSGVLVIDKPAGVTSARVVAQVKRVLGGPKVGHTGTLDPLATGVLPLCVGEATKIAGYLLAEDKGYEVELCLGVETDTLDAGGQVVRERPAEAAAVTREALAAALAAKVGASDQVPPMFSAIKHQGRRLHALARRGETVARAARHIHIYKLELLGFSPPRAQARVACSKGTYVRSLVADLGAALGCGAHVTALRRTRAGAFDLGLAVPLAEVTPERAAAALIPPAVALGELPAVALSGERLTAAQNGKPFSWDQISAEPPPAPDAPFRLLSPAADLVAICTTTPAGQIRYRRVFRP